MPQAACSSVHSVQAPIELTNMVHGDLEGAVSVDPVGTWCVMVSNVEPTVPQPRLLGPRQSLPAGSRGRTALDVWEKRLKSWAMGFLTFWWGVRDRERRL